MKNEINNSILQNCTELLLPAGELDVLRVAVDNGADAVYVGASAFSARGNAANFNQEALAEAVAYAHERSARVYLALNTLIADDELPAALNTAVSAAALGVDAIIMQDIGLAVLIAQALPGLPLHASTQMTIYDEAALKTLYASGFRRIILPREFSLAEVAGFTKAAHAIGMETEMFIHGALCVSVSGQCLYSSFASGRSGNRGICAQPCRLDYRLREDDRLLPSAACLSPKDQAGFKHIKEIIATGVDSLKIEGRMRSAAYVAHTAAVYRDLLDGGSENDNKEERLLLAFNRGGSFTDRAFSGRKDRSFLSGANVGSHGIEIGSVAEIRAKGNILVIDLLPAVSPPERGDVISVRRTVERLDEMVPAARAPEVASAPIGTLEQFGNRFFIQAFHPDVLKKLRTGDSVYRMNSAQADRQVLTSQSRKTAVKAELSSESDNILLRLCVNDGPFGGTSVETSAIADQEIERPLTIERAEKQLAKTGGTAYQLIDLKVNEPVQLSISGLNQLRRSAFALLSERLAASSKLLADPKILTNLLSELQDLMQPLDYKNNLAEPEAIIAPFQVTAYFYTWPDPEDVIACGADVYLLPAAGLEDTANLEQLKRLRVDEPTAVCVLVLPPAAAGLQAEAIRQWRRDGTLNLFDRISGGLPGLAEIAAEAGLGFEADSTANIYNQVSLLKAFEAGASATCPSVELTGSQLLRLAACAGKLNAERQAADRQEAGKPGSNARRFDRSIFYLEWFVYGRQRLMYSSYCPVGSNVAGCNRCEGHRYHLQDRKARQMPLLLAPPYCTVTILNAEPITPPTNLPQLIKLAPARLRLLFLEERQAERTRLVNQMRVFERIN